MHYKRNDPLSEKMPLSDSSFHFQTRSTDPGHGSIGKRYADYIYDIFGITLFRADDDVLPLRKLSQERSKSNHHKDFLRKATA